MKVLELMTPAHLFVEFGYDRLTAFNGTTGLELPLERSPEGRLTDDCKNSLIRSLESFIQHKAWQPRPRVFCAVGSRGVSLRRITLPAASKQELQRLLPLQIESEFPLPPEQLAWGCQTLNGARNHEVIANGKVEVLVAAVKKDSLEEYATVLSRCGAVPVFTLGALARSYVCPQPPCPYAVLTVDRLYSELISFDAGVPVAVRVLPWGTENLPAAQPNQRGTVQSQSAMLLGSSTQASFGGSGAAPAEPTLPDPLEPLVRLINSQALGRRLYVLLAAAPHPDLDLPARLGSRLGDGVDCLSVDLALGQTRSAAILGLQQAVERLDGWPPLVLQAKQTNGKASRIAQEAPLKWAAAAVGLLLLALLLPYAEALTLKSHLANKLAGIKTDLGRLATMDRELDFLQYLKQNEPPYLDALLVLAKVAPPGTRFDSVSINRRGELALRGSLHDGQQVAELRSKLIDSGFFESVGIEEQTPSPDRQKVTVRMNAQWKPAVSRTTPSLEPGHKPSVESRRSPNAPSLPAAADSSGPGPAAPKETRQLPSTDQNSPPETQTNRNVRR